MLNRLNSLKNKIMMKKNDVVRFVLCFLFFIFMGFILCINIYQSCWQEQKETKIINSDSSIFSFMSGNEVKQQFYINGFNLRSLFLYIGEIDSDLDLSISDRTGVLFSKKIAYEEIHTYAWNEIQLSNIYIAGEGEYQITLSVNKGNGLFPIGTESQDYIGDLWIDGDKVSGSIPLGMEIDAIISMPEKILHTVLLTIVSFIIIFLGCCFLLQIKRSSGKELVCGGGFIPAFFCAILFLSYFYPIENYEIKYYPKMIGRGVVLGKDINVLLKHYFFIFVLFLLVFAIFLNYFNNTKKQYIQQISESIDLNTLSLLAIVSIIINVRNEGNILLFFCTLYFLFIMFVTLNEVNNTHLEYMYKLIVIVFCLALPLTIFISGFSGIAFLLLFKITTVVLLFFVYIFYEITKSSDEYLISILVITCSLIPFITSLYIEVCYILNRHSVFVTGMRRKYALILLSLVLFSVLFAKVTHNKNINLIKWKSWSYIWIVIGATALYVQPQFQTIYNSDIIESANYSVLISDFLYFGKLPLVQHYGGHMLSNVISGILYGLINNDKAGAIFSPYSGYIMVVLAVLFYCFLRNIYSKETALIITLFFPFYRYWSYFGLGVLVYFTLVKSLNNNKYIWISVYFLSLVACFLYRADLGIGFGISSIICLFVYCFYYKKRHLLKCYIIIGGILFCSILCVCVVLCLVNSINPLCRLYEFIQISRSNLNWAYGQIGDSESFAYVWCYILVPVFMACGLVTLLGSNKIKAQCTSAKWLLLLLLNISYFVNFQRGIVRHSLMEMQSTPFLGNISKDGDVYIIWFTYILWTAYIFLALLICELLKRKYTFLLTYLSFMVITCMLYLDKLEFGDTIFDMALYKTEQHVATWTNVSHEWNGKTLSLYLKDKGTPSERVTMDVSLENCINSYKRVIDCLLDEEETFVDFSNRSFLYSALARQNPTYVSQSPMQLVDEFTQKEFISQIENIPIVIMPVNSENCSMHIDGIANNIRCRFVARYIYENYSPLCATYSSTPNASFAIWCLKEKYDEMYENLKVIIDTTKKDEGMTQDIIKYISYGYDDPIGNCFSEFHHYYIHKLPYIYGRYLDTNDERLTVVNQNDNIYSFSINQKKYNTLLVEIVADGSQISEEGQEASLEVGKLENVNFANKYIYYFELMPGKHSYLFFLDNDYYWTTSELDAVRLWSNGDYIVTGVAFMEE